MAVRRPFDWIGFALMSGMFFCFTYLFNQGSRWNWFDEPRILWFTLTGVALLVTFLGQQALARGRGVLDFSLFRSDDFSFAFVVSFVAGAALFGSAFLIPSFAVSVLAFTPTDAGQLLLPSGALFVGALLVAAFLMQARGAPPIVTVPFGILTIMAAMWMLSGSTSESGAPDMMAAILLRGIDGPIRVGDHNYNGHMPSFASVLTDVEVGELATALHNNAPGKTPSPEERANLSEEFADVLAWLTTLANINGGDLEVACRKYTEKGVEGVKD